MPFFAEAPYFLWGEVNYDSEGNCPRPTDRSWTELELTNRQTHEQVSVAPGPRDPAHLAGSAGPGRSDADYRRRQRRERTAPGLPDC
jgi:hypothetical protein